MASSSGQVSDHQLELQLEIERERTKQLEERMERAETRLKQLELELQIQTGMRHVCLVFSLSVCVYARVSRVHCLS